MSVCANLLECEDRINGSNLTGFYESAMLEVVPEWVYVHTYDDYMPWMWAMFGSILVGLSGILPLLVIPIDQTDDLKQGEGASTLKTLLSFAVGGILGDVFLHSLPEIWANDMAKKGGIPGHHSIWSGLLVLSGLIIFLITEKLFSVITHLADAHPVENTNNNIKGADKETECSNNKQITGYLNLLANCMDNFTHGLSLGGAFLVSWRIGCLTTFAILVHEIPHEVGDFAILLKSGFTRWDAAKYQIITAGGGLIGSLCAIGFSGATNSMEARTSWILPFTAGTFLHVALVTVLPDLLKEEDPKESLKQFSALILGIVIMAVVTVVCE